MYYIIYNALTSTLYEYKSYPKRQNYIAHKFHIHAETLDWKRLSVSTMKADMYIWNLLFTNFLAF